MISWCLYTHQISPVVFLVTEWELHDHSSASFDHRPYDALRWQSSKADTSGQTYIIVIWGDVMYQKVVESSEITWLFQTNPSVEIWSDSLRISSDGSLQLQQLSTCFGSFRICDDRRPLKESDGLGWLDDFRAAPCYSLKFFSEVRINGDGIPESFHPLWRSCWTRRVLGCPRNLK